jgi:hypothetical protein
MTLPAEDFASLAFIVAALISNPSFTQTLSETIARESEANLL